MPDRLATLVILLLALVPIPRVLAAEAWPTTRFEVFVGNPFIGDNDSILQWIEFQDLFDRPDDASIAKMQTALSEAADWYAAHHFPPPLLEPIVDTDQGPAYRVYACAEDAGQAAWEQFWTDAGFGDRPVANLPWGQCEKTGAYLSLCNSDPTRTKIVYLNYKQIFDSGGNLTEAGYQTIAHEMMHAIVANTPAGRSDPGCTVDKWIGEGIADAIGFDVADEVWKGRFQKGTSTPEVIKRHGYRPYSELFRLQIGKCLDIGTVFIARGKEKHGESGGSCVLGRRLGNHGREDPSAHALCVFRDMCRQ
jgi:hypothetical protein